MTHRAGFVGPDQPRTVLLIVGCLLAFGSLLGVWLALSGQFDLQDLVAGSATAVVAVAVGFLVGQRGRAAPGVRWVDVRSLASLPVQLTVETWQVFAAAAGKLAGREVAVGAWSTVAVVTGPDAGGWPAARRDAVLTALWSFSPNTIVVDIDAEAGRALIHRLVGEGSERALGGSGRSASDVDGSR